MSAALTHEMASFPRIILNPQSIRPQNNSNIKLQIIIKLTRRFKYYLHGRYFNPNNDQKLTKFVLTRI